MKSKEEILDKYLKDNHGPAETYRDILKAMEEYALQQPGPRWVKASERLPEPGLIHFKSGYLHDVVFYDKKNGFYKPKAKRTKVDGLVRTKLETEIVPIKMPLNQIEWLDESPVSTPSSEGMAEALAKFFAKECKVGDPLLSIIDSIYDDWKLVYDKLRIETSFSEAAIQANKFVIEKYASLSSPGSGWVSVEDAKPNGRLCAVLVCNNWAPEHKRCTRTAIWFGQTNKFFMDCDNAFTAHEISHWQPLPAPPGVEDNQTKKQ